MNIGNSPANHPQTSSIVCKDLNLLLLKWTDSCLLIKMSLNAHGLSSEDELNSTYTNQVSDQYSFILKNKN